MLLSSRKLPISGLFVGIGLTITDPERSVKVMEVLIAVWL